jgi:hypothetical protein
LIKQLFTQYKKKKSFKLVLKCGREGRITCVVEEVHDLFFLMNIKRGHIVDFFYYKKAKVFSSISDTNMACLIYYSNSRKYLFKYSSWTWHGNQLIANYNLLTDVCM